MLTSGGPEQSTTVLMMRIRGLALGANSNPGVATAMAICLGLIMIVISLFQAKYMRKFGE
jgi:multiple sugar transport system permease protein